MFATLVSTDLGMGILGSLNRGIVMDPILTHSRVGDVLKATFGQDFFEKLAAEMVPANSSLAGIFYMPEHRGRPWGNLSVPNALVRGVFQAMAEPGIELPPEGDSGQLDAHITVIRPEEIMAVGGPDKFKPDRGKQFRYSLGRLMSVEPQGWAEMSKAWMLRVHSPELSALRRSYGLSARPKNDKFDFHITVAVRRKKVLQRGEITKVVMET